MQETNGEAARAAEEAAAEEKKAADEVGKSSEQFFKTFAETADGQNNADDSKD